MSNRVIFTTVFRTSFPHLDKPHAQNPTDTPKYGLAMMFPKNGICRVNNQPSGVENIIAALDEVCMEEFQMGFYQATAPGMGINFPPNFKDGDTVFEKDQQGNPIPGQIAPQSAGMWILGVKNEEPVGTVGTDGTTDVLPSTIYAGSWARAQLEISAYTSKNGRVVVAKVLNVQLCYDDEKFGGRPVTQSASQAFGGMAVTDTNVANTMQPGGAMPAVQPGQPGVQPQMQQPGQPGVQPQMQQPGQPGVQPQMQQPGMQPQMQQPGQPGVQQQMQQPGQPNYLNPVQ